MTSPPLLYFSCGSTADRANLLLRRHQQHSVRLCVGSFAALRQAVGLRCLHQGRVQRFHLTGAHCRSDPDVLRSRPPAVVGLRSPLAYSWRLALVLNFGLKLSISLSQRLQFWLLLIVVNHSRLNLCLSHATSANKTLSIYSFVELFFSILKNTSLGTAVSYFLLECF